MELLLALFVVALIAGWVDAIGGGGGLICIPALLWAGFTPLETLAEVSNNQGRIDMALRFVRPDGLRQVYVIEFKMVKGTEGDGSALQQIKENDYAAPYRDGQHRITLVGMEFSAQARNVVGFAWEQLNA